MMHQKLDSGIEKGYLYWGFPSWTERYGFFCEKRHDRVSNKAFLLIFSTIICLGLLFFCDIFGRKRVIVSCSVIILLGIIISTDLGSIFSDSMGFKMIGIALAGGAEGAFSALFNLIINESTCKLMKIIFKKCQIRSLGATWSPAASFPTA